MRVGLCAGLRLISRRTLGTPAQGAQGHRAGGLGPRKDDSAATPAATAPATPAERQPRKQRRQRPRRPPAAGRFGRHAGEITQRREFAVRRLGFAIQANCIGFMQWNTRQLFYRKYFLTRRMIRMKTSLTGAAVAALLVLGSTLPGFAEDPPAPQTPAAQPAPATPPAAQTEAPSSAVPRPAIVPKAAEPRANRLTTPNRRHAIGAMRIIVTTATATIEPLIGSRSRSTGRISITTGSTGIGSPGCSASDRRRADRCAGTARATT